MRHLPLDTGYGPVRIYGSSLHTGHDFRVVANAPPEGVEVFVLLDSRGVSAAWEGSLAQLLHQQLAATPHLIIVRPLTMTTWATLYNVMADNPLSPRLVITNAGFVDTTPKKAALCGDVVAQIGHGLPGVECRIAELEEYRLSSGEYERLCTIEYGEDYHRALRLMAQARETVAIKTPLVSPAVPLRRTRPASFYTQLAAANQLIDAVGCPSVDPGEFGADFTYDAVHWTPAANRVIFEKLRTWL